MSELYRYRSEFEEFSTAFEQFKHLVSELKNSSSMKMEHGEIEELIELEGREILRRLLQGHLVVQQERCAMRELRDQTMFLAPMNEVIANGIWRVFLEAYGFIATSIPLLKERASFHWIAN